MSTVKHKVFRWNEPKGARLAKIVYDRCKRNIEKYNATGKGKSRVTALSKSPKDDSYRYFHIVGRTPADERAWKAAWTKAYGGESAARESIRWAMDHSRASDNLMLHGKSYGWSAKVLMTIEGPFDIVVEDGDAVPPEIIKCLVASYNELVEDRDDG